MKYSDKEMKEIEAVLASREVQRMKLVAQNKEEANKLLQRMLLSASATKVYTVSSIRKQRAYE
jgi:hypothetical protein